MFFGLTFLASLLGYAMIAPFGDDDVDDVDEEEYQNPTDAARDSESLLSDTAIDESEEVDDTKTTVAVIEGTDADDSIYGGNANDVIYGGDGNYIINGGSGDDHLRGGDGSHIINGEGGDDRLFAGNGNVDNSSNTLNGGEGDDVLFGSNDPQNQLNGGEGDDEIHMYGQDIATGGEGADKFYSNTEHSNGEVSIITDYNANEDLIVIEYATSSLSGAPLNEPEISIDINGDDATICIDGEEYCMVKDAANSLTIGNILLEANPII